MGETAEKTREEADARVHTTRRGIVIRGDDLHAHVVVKNVADRGYREVIARSIGGAIGYHAATEFEHIYPMGLLARHHEKIAETYRNWHEPESCMDFGEVLRRAAAISKELEKAVQENIAKGIIEYEDLPYYFTVGCHAVGYMQGELIGGVVDSVKRVSGWFEDYQAIMVKVLVDKDGRVCEDRFRLKIHRFMGQQPIDSLSVVKPSAEMLEYLTQRGEVFRKYAGKPSYVAYTGLVTRAGWRSLKSYRADGRAMLDPRSFSQIDSDQYRNEGYMDGLESDDDDRDTGAAPTEGIQIPDSELWRTYPYLWGFSFAAKQWGRFAVSGMSDIKWRKDAFEKLVLDEDRKKLVKALVENSTGTFSDIIEGKGGGVIFLLHGPPGQGKTLTAEAVSELLEKPLYSVSIGELGTDPDALEARLREVLDIATVWDAVVLMDEADIFLEARDERDIVRNAMVGVFLRLLEYHQGVLFLTTNRVRNIDSAFYSRISVALHFTKGASDKRARIWTNLLNAAKIEGLDVEDLEGYELNGRQIKNVIRLSQTLAASESCDVNIQIVRQVIDLTTSFQKEIEG